MRQRPSRGFTYLGLIILTTIIGLVGAAGLKMGTLPQRAAAEEELLEIGAQFSAAMPWPPRKGSCNSRPTCKRC
jgi:hypothetical protein